MVEIKEQYPYIDNNGVEHFDLIKHWAENEKGKKYHILQVETGVEYEEAVDKYPTQFTYNITNKEIPVIEVAEETQQGE